MHDIVYYTVGITSIRYEPFTIPDYEVTTRLRGDLSNYDRAYVKPPRPPYPVKWRGPRLRTTTSRPSLTPRRYRVCFNRITP